jgi:hypothetical protein
MEVSGQVHVSIVLTPEKDSPVPIGQEAGWAPEPVWTLWKIENFPVSSENQTSVIQPVACRHFDFATYFFSLLSSF